MATRSEKEIIVLAQEHAQKMNQQRLDFLSKTQQIREGKDVIQPTSISGTESGD